MRNNQSRFVFFALSANALLYNTSKNNNINNQCMYTQMYVYAKNPYFIKRILEINFRNLYTKS